MDTVSFIKLILGLAVCAVPFGIGARLILQSKRDERELEKIRREDFPSLAADTAASD